MNPKDSPHSAETRAACVAALLEGQSVSKVARDYKIPLGTVSRWKHTAYKENGVDDPEPRSQKQQIGNLVLEYLGANLRGLKAQAELFSNPEWLAKQPANELAVLHGVMTDKAVRLLEALSAGQEEEDPQEADWEVLPKDGPPLLNAGETSE